MANNIIKRVWNQNRMVNIEDLCGMAFQAESGGHTFAISGVDDTGAAVPLSGTVAGVFRRPDNADIALTGSASNGVVSVTLTDDCYAVPGRFGLTVFVTSGGQKTAVYAAVGTVAATNGGAVAGDTPQDVVDLINAIAAAMATIPADYTDLMGDIANTYSNTALYPVGSYAWYNGALKRCTVAITAGETYTAAHWQDAVLGDDVTMLHNALDLDNAVSVLALVPMTRGVTNGVTYRWDGETMTMSGTSNSSGSGCNIWLNTTPYLPKGIAPGDVLYLKMSGMTSVIRFNMAFYDDNNNVIGDDLYRYMAQNYTITVPSNAVKAKIRIWVSANTVTNTSVSVKIIKYPTNKELGNRLDIIEPIVGNLDKNNASDAMVPVTPRTFSLNGISWTATNASIKAERTASNSSSSYLSLFESNDSIPDTMEAGGVYEVKYSSENIELIVYDRTSGSPVALFRTFDGGTLAIPETTTSLYIRLLVASDAISVGSSETVAVPQFLDAMTNKELSTAVSSLASNTDKIAVQSYSDITVSSKRWDEKMKLGDSSVLGHTQNYKIIPGADYYVGTIGYVNNGVMGCFLDFNELPLKPLRASDCSEVSYPYTTDNPNTDFTLFTKLYKFTAPANAHYLSMNFTLTASEHWKFFLSNIPMFREGNSGDLVVYENSHMRHKKAKKLCVVGPSYAMIDRRIQSAYGNKYIVGFQEYLLPFYDSITTFGYSGGTWGQFRDSDYISIYSGIVSGYGSVLPKDFTPFDEVLLIGCNPNGFFSTPRQEEGTAGTYASNTSPVSSFMGGMRGVIEYILNQKPEMKIYLSNFWHTSGNNVSAFRDTCDNLNAEMLKLANLFGLQYIDMYNGTPFNKWNYTTSNLQYTYDGTHPNNAGMREIANVLVRAMI